MPSEIREQAAELAEIYGLAVVAERKALEQKIKKAAEEVLRAGNEILQERNWSQVEKDRNFAQQLRRGDIANYPFLNATLQEIINAKRIDVATLTTLVRFSNLPEFKADNTLPQEMFDLYLDLAGKLNFPKENIARVKERGITAQQKHKPILRTELKHSELPIAILFMPDYRPQSQNPYTFIDICQKYLSQKR